MYLHIGADVIVKKSAVVAVLDLDNTTGSRTTRDFLAAAERGGRVINAAEDLPKSFVLCRDEKGERVYLSQLSPATLLRRSGTEGLREF